MSSTAAEYRRQEIEAVDAFDVWMRDEGMSEAQVEAARADDAPSERRSA